MGTFGNAVLTLAVRVLVGLFAVGVVGSALVLVLTTIDDAKVLFTRDGRV
jgi:hypothetical protein